MDEANCGRKDGAWVDFAFFLPIFRPYGTVREGRTFFLPIFRPYGTVREGRAFFLPTFRPYGTVREGRVFSTDILSLTGQDAWVNFAPSR